MKCIACKTEFIPSYSKKAKFCADCNKTKAYRRHFALKHYDLTDEQISKMLKAQYGGCAICKRTLTKPHIDHCHQTGITRGLLCQNCNLGLGLFKDSVFNLQQAIDYLCAAQVADINLKETMISKSSPQ